ncbi:hypothetical protein [Bacillus sp. MYb56]|nr:hypothetical protein [Bacillus sp. MYb56]
MFKFIFKKDADKTEVHLHVNFDVIISAVLGSTTMFELIQQLLLNS